MRIDFERSGGVAGTRLAVAIDSRSLKPQEITTLERLLQRSDFFRAPSALGRKETSADRFHYVVTIADSARKHTITRVESELSPSMRELIDWLTEVSRRRPAGDDHAGG